MRQYLLITKAFHRHLGGTYLAQPHAMSPSMPAENKLLGHVVILFSINVREWTIHVLVSIKSH